jgi:putative glutamine amidotransferase
MANRPLVVVTGRLRAAGDPGGDRVRSTYYSPTGYADAIVRAGGRPLVVPPVTHGDLDPTEWLAGADALVLTGGPDVDPTRYGQTRHPADYGIDAGIDDHEEALLRLAVDRDLPILAVCRGAQLLNVVFGGTLIQDLPSETDGSTDHGAPVDRRPVQHEVEIDQGTRLGDALGVSHTMIWSIHHQAIGRIAPGLVVTARAADGTVEGIEPADPAAGWIVAVQWHPEWRAPEDAIQQRLFDTLIGRAAAHAAGQEAGAALRS